MYVLNKKASSDRTDKVCARHSVYERMKHMVHLHWRFDNILSNDTYLFVGGDSKR